MSASAPITQDVLTIPRKLPDGPTNIVGLTRDQMRAALIAVNNSSRFVLSRRVATVECCCAFNVVGCCPPGERDCLQFCAGPKAA